MLFCRKKSTTALCLLSLLYAINAEGISLLSDDPILYRSCIEECKGKPNGFKLIDPTDCTSFYVCYKTMIFQQYCEHGTVFNWAAQMCYPGKCPPCTNNSKPPDPNTPTDPPTTIDPVTSTDPTDIPTTLDPTTSTDPITPIDPVTPIDPNTPDCLHVENGRRFPSNLHCRFFWQCISNQAVKLFCEKGLWYDRDYYVCKFPSMVHNCPANQD